MISEIKNVYPINCRSVFQPISSKDIETEMYKDIYYFSNDWVSDNQRYWIDTISSHINPASNINVLEVGAFEGRLTIFLHDTVLNKNKCKYYCIDNFGVSDNKFFIKKGINTKYDNSAAKKRFLHNTRYLNNVQLIEGSFNLSIVPDNILFDIIIIDTTSKTMLSYVKDCINIINLHGLILITYEISVSQMSKLKKIIPCNFKLKAKFCRNKKTFYSIYIQSSCVSDNKDLQI